jgi:hypothetical protein
MTRVDLPEPIAAYFEADHGDGNAVASCFTNHGVVRDESATHCGLAAIETWKNAASAKYSFTTEPLAVEHADGHYIVTSRVSGNFPGTPVDLRFAFRLERGKIAFLEIT